MNNRCRNKTTVSLLGPFHIFKPIAPSHLSTIPTLTLIPRIITVIDGGQALSKQNYGPLPKHFRLITPSLNSNIHFPIARIVTVISGDNRSRNKTTDTPKTILSHHTFPQLQRSLPSPSNSHCYQRCTTALETKLRATPKKNTYCSKELHAKMEETLRIKEFNEEISSHQFESQFEPLSIPLVFRGCVNDWRAFECWNPANGGFDYLQERVGNAVVEVMLSKCAPVFYGDIKSHERVPVPFSSFINFCKKGLSKDKRRDVCTELETLQSTEEDTDILSSFTDAREQIYLAQFPIFDREKGESMQLDILREDLNIPSFLESKTLSSINLWMNNAQSRSSTHYDPHHNLLCVVAGCKQVVLWPPSSGPLLYPMPIYGEASNHSAVTLDTPDLSCHPRFGRSGEYSQKVVLQAGDALFIPEGWYHQVDSDELTIAVNLWWQSNLMSCMLEHMDAYYLRRILRRLVDKEMIQMLPKTSVEDSDRMRGSTYEPFNEENADCQGNAMHAQHKKKPNVDVKLQDLGPPARQGLRRLVSLVHDGLNAGDQPEQCTSPDDPGTSTNGSCEKKLRSKSNILEEGNEQDQCTSTTNSRVASKGFGKNTLVNKVYCLEDDPIANVIWQLRPLDLRTVFLAMVHNFPRTLEALILHLLSPVGAEVVTRKFDELDQQMTDEERSSFYQRFYSVFDDQFAAMDAILNGKELFALQAFKNVLQLYVGVTVDSNEPLNHGRNVI